MSFASENLHTHAHATAPSRFAIVVHGGAGDLTDERKPMHAAGCAEAARRGAEILRKGGTALDAVEATVRVLEDDAIFNAGTGACLNEDGLIELDASIMEGTSLRAGAVAAMPPFQNPIAIARAILEKNRHVLYASHGAARFALANGFTRSTTEAMRTEAAFARWKEVRDGGGEGGWAGGTVGAVARDVHGHLAAATSTGGTMNKGAGRIGDSPILGAGNYADDTLGAVSATGNGESFMRSLIALRACERARDALDAVALARTLGEALESMHARVGGLGGLVLVDPAGRIAWARITRTMSYAWVREADGREEESSGA